MPQNMAGHVLMKELVAGESSAAETTQHPDIVEDSSQISKNNLDSDDGLLLWNRSGLEPLSSNPIPALLASSTGLHLGKCSDNLITSPSLETIEPPSPGESFSIDEFLSGVRLYCMMVTGACLMVTTA